MRQGRYFPGRSQGRHRRGGNASRRLPTPGRWYALRRFTRGAALVLVASAPFFDVLRLDLPARSVVLLGRHLWLSDFYLLLLLLLAAMFGFATLSVLLGRVFCGWLCPQTTVTAIALATVRLLRGRRNPLPEPIPPAELTGGRRLLFYAAAAAASLAGGFFLSAYFVEPGRLVASLASPARAERPVLLLFLGISAGLFADAVLLRQRLCLVCPLGAAMSLLRGEEALQVGAATAHAEEACGRCAACRRLCPFGLDPRRPDPRLCTNCGECLLACAAVSAARGQERPLGFGFGPRDAAPAEALGKPPLRRRSLARGRALLTGTMTAVLLGAFALGLARRPPVALAIERVPAAAPGALHILLRNQVRRPLTVELAVEPPRGWQAAPATRRLHLAPARQARVALALLPPPAAAPGPYPFEVLARPRELPGRTVRLRSAVFLSHPAPRREESSYRRSMDF